MQFGKYSLLPKEQVGRSKPLEAEFEKTFISLFQLTQCFLLYMLSKADGAKRRARVLIPPAIYTRGNESISEV